MKDATLNYRTAAMAAGLVAALGVAGCGGIGPGDYVIYRVAMGSAKNGGDCAPDDNTKSDSSTFRTSSTFILYGGPDDAFYLDTGTTTVSGVEEGDGYKFTGKSVDVQFAANGDKSTHEEDTTITMAVDGAAVNGSIRTTTRDSYACVDPNQCPTDMACTRTVPFVGAEVEDVNLEHDPG